MNKVLVFYATLLYGEYEYTQWCHSLRLELPDGCYIRYQRYAWRGDPIWYRKDLTPVLIEDVPKEIKALCLLMGIPITP